jgi:predicted GNAT family acetyltransferase
MPRFRERLAASALQLGEAVGLHPIGNKRNGHKNSSEQTEPDARIVQGKVSITGTHAPETIMHPLDNVIWQALGTRHASFAHGNGLARKFVPEVSSLAALLEPTPAGYEALASLMAEGDVAALAFEAPREPPGGWAVVRAAPMLQMVHQEDPVSSATSSDLPLIVELGSADAPEMVALAKLTQPGPFSIRTHELGVYLGIHYDGALVAMAGERLKIPGFSEVSAVCTHPDHTGRGYARILMAEVMGRIRSRGETPFLHVLEDNVRAIDLYKRLGFAERVLLHLSVIRKNSESLEGSTLRSRE